MYLKSLAGYFVLLLIAGLLAFFAYTAMYYIPIANSEDKILNFKETGITLTDRNGTPFYYLNNSEESEYVPIANISPNIQKAVVATEDEEFYNHHGISIKGILRSIALNIQSQSFSFGGSTLTQQLIKNTLLTSEKSLSRKLKEAFLSLYIERRYSKDKILEMYLNTVYFGEGAVGIAEASHRYFGKSPSDLHLSESAYLAGILQSPSALSPYTGDVDRGNEERVRVIEKMFTDGNITASQKDEAIAHNLQFKKQAKEAVSKAPHFALLVQEKLKEKYGEDVVYDGITVKTTLNLEWQEYAETVVEDRVNANLYNGVSNGAAVAMDPETGEVLVLVGSKDWFDEKFGKVDMATVPRQPGSTFKPIVYSLAFENGSITPATTLLDAPRTFGQNYKPKNYDNRYRGRVTARRALANSLNVPAVDVMQRVGVESVLERAKDFGITSLREASDYGPSLVLGSGEVSLLEMTNAYSTFANNGSRLEPTLILEVKDKYGELIYKSKPEHTQVIDEEAAYLVNSILSDRAARSEVFGSMLNVPFQAAVKTGTTEDYRDAWTIGYTPNLVVGVWVGNNDNTPMRNQSGSLAASPIWRTLIQRFHESSKNFERPDGIVSLPTCSQDASSSARIEYFIAGTQPGRNCVSQPLRREVVMRENNRDGEEENEDERDDDSNDDENRDEPTPTPETLEIGGFEVFADDSITPTPTVQ